MSNPGRVLIVDDEKNITFVIQAMLERAGFETLVFNDSAAAMNAIEEEELDVVITDLYMPGPGGMEILAHCQAGYSDLPVVLITAYGTVESAVAALKRGAFDFITKPFEQVELLNTVNKAVATHRQRLKEPIALFPSRASSAVETGSDNTPGGAVPGGGGGSEPVSPQQQQQQRQSVIDSISSIIGASAPMQEVFRVISKIAASPSTVLVSGESGTGKELVAYEIHRNSSRVKKPFIKINCAAIPSTLIESELFGHEKGAFTGAVSSKPGRFELAHEGTLFLDEVAEMPLEMQVKLLRVLQEHEFERVGGVSTIRTDVRIIAATNRDLEAEVKTGRFREDLYYRLNVVPIALPPLRERREDIDALVRYFLEGFNQSLGRAITHIEPACFEALKAYPWPGNIRQLENVIERMVLMSDENMVTAKDLPEELHTYVPTRAGGAGFSLDPRSGIGSDDDASSALPFKELVRKQTQTVERELIERALEENSGNVTRTAEKLGLSRKGLQLKIKELGLKRPID